MDLNEPITLDGERLFCPRGNHIALKFLNEARMAVLNTDSALPSDIRNRVIHSLNGLISHRSCCPYCTED
jgi:hypothetical protein